jgi:dinuclear metal center YbgI/SA1388 family protein
MEIKVRDIYDFLNEYAPFSTQEEWDNSGLTVGSFEKEVSRIFVALDVTKKTIDEAKNWGADLVITHHPMIFTPISQVTDDMTVYEAVISGMSFIASHTCLDKAVGGVNTCLAEKTGLKNITDTEDGFLKIGEIETTSADRFAEHLKNSLGGSVSYTDSGKPITKVAFCSGGGGDFVALAKKIGADAFLTGEAKHHEFLLSEDVGISLFAAGHYETENIVCEKLKDVLNERFLNQLEVKISDLKNPIKSI